MRYSRSSRVLLLTLFLSSLHLFGETRYFAQIGDGEVPGLRFQTSFLLLNTGAATQAKLAFFDNQGRPFELSLEGRAAAAVVELDLEASESVSLLTSGEGSLQIGYARLEAPADVGAVAVFSGVRLPEEVLLYEAGVPATPSTSHFSVLVDSRGDRNTGVALVAEGSGSAPSQNEDILLELFDQEGKVAETILSLSEGEKHVSFVHELFQEEAVRQKALEMEGSLRVTAPATLRLAAVTLRQLLTSQPFPDEIPTLTTFPVMEAAESSNWQLVWSDEFEGNEIDSTRWSFQFGTGTGEGLVNWGNSELQYYTDRPENARVEDGILHIVARRESFGQGAQARNYTSARLRTKNRGDWTFGRFEIRAKLPEGQGLWPALWMLPTDEAYGDWAASGEIDIMEYKGHEPETVYGTIHFGGTWPNHQYSGIPFRSSSQNFAEAFHVFALEWEPGEIRWYVDRILFQRQTQWSTTEAPFPAPFDERFHLLMNLAVGGNFLGEFRDPSETEFPQEMLIDYVRVYQRME